MYVLVIQDNGNNNNKKGGRRTTNPESTMPQNRPQLTTSNTKKYVRQNAKVYADAMSMEAFWLF